MNPDLSQKTLKKDLHYDPATGIFTRSKSKRGINSRKGDIAGSINGCGYIDIGIKGKTYRAHRLAFLYMEGEFPLMEVDHTNHIRTDNSWKNLRKVSSADNAHNRSKSERNTSGVTGVSWYVRDNKWKSCITVSGQRIHLGYFVEFHEAVNARKNAEVLYGFHKNHGEKVC